MASGTLDANSEAFTVQLNAGEYAAVTLDISATITVTGAANGVAYTKPDGTAAAWTASDHFIVTGPGTFVFTASGVSGGSCAYNVVKWFTDKGHMI